MAVADDLEQERAALKMINPAPYNAEAPPEALADDITPVALHYVRSNFAVPTHNGRLEIGGAVGKPTTLTLDDLRRLPAVERAVTLECAGNGRLATARCRSASPGVTMPSRPRAGRAHSCATSSSRRSRRRAASRSSSRVPITARTTSSRSSQRPTARI